jgi:hypothetical protein
MGKTINSKGEPAEGLKDDDFQIYEDGKKVPTTCFEEQKNQIERKAEQILVQQPGLPEPVGIKNLKPRGDNLLQEGAKKHRYNDKIEHHHLLD